MQTVTITFRTGAYKERGGGESGLKLNDKENSLIGNDKVFLTMKYHINAGEEVLALNTGAKIIASHFRGEKSQILIVHLSAIDPNNELDMYFGLRHS